MHNVHSLQVDPNAPKKKTGAKKTAADVKSNGGLNPIAVLILLLAIAAGFYFTQMKK
jgi:hypothetical protein